MVSLSKAANLNFCTGSFFISYSDLLSCILATSLNSRIRRGCCSRKAQYAGAEELSLRRSIRSLWALGLAGVLASTSGCGLGIRARELETKFQKVGLHGALPPLVWTLWRLILSRLDFRCRHAANR